MKIFNPLIMFLKNLNKRSKAREILFYQKKNLKFKIFATILKEFIFILKHSSIIVKSAQITYTFILSIVPFLSILFTFVHSFHGFENLFKTSISPLITKHFGNTVGLQISDYIKMFIKNIEVRELGVISFITFSITVIIMLLSIENNFNEIMHFKNDKGIFQRFLKCWIIITITPFFFALTAIKSDPLIHLVGSNLPMFLESTVIKSLRFFIGFCFQSIFFIFLYYVIPSKRLNFKSVLYGGIFASILFEILQYINIYLAKTALYADPSKIYGTVPLIAVLFFTWIRLGWIVTLLGAAFSLSCQRILFFRKETNLKDYPAKDLLHCISIYCAISKIHKETRLPVSLTHVLIHTKIPINEIHKWIQYLIKRDIIFTTMRDHCVSYCPSFYALGEEQNVSEFLNGILFSNQLNIIKNYHDIEKYFLMCLNNKGQNLSTRNTSNANV